MREKNNTHTTVHDRMNKNNELRNTDKNDVKQEQTIISDERNKSKSFTFISYTPQHHENVCFENENKNNNTQQKNG